MVPPLTGLARHMFIDLVIVIKSGKVGTPLTGLARHMFIDLVIVIKSRKVGINRFSPSYVYRSSHSYKSGKVGTHGLFVCSMVALRFDDVGRVIDHH